MHFGENQLSPSSLGISPLPTAHPNTFPRAPVRASTPCYRGFTLAMGSSLGFGSAPTNLPSRKRAAPYSDSLSLRLRHASALTFQASER